MQFRWAVLQEGTETPPEEPAPQAPVVPSLQPTLASPMVELTETSDATGAF